MPHILVKAQRIQVNAYKVWIFFRKIPKQKKKEKRIVLFSPFLFVCPFSCVRVCVWVRAQKLNAFNMRFLKDIRKLHWMGDQHHTAISSMLVILFIACTHIITINAQQKGDEVCETLPSEIHLIKGSKSVFQLNFKWWFISHNLTRLFVLFFFSHLLYAEEYDELGRLQRTCNGEVQVNKCEGLCNSQVQPSVITPTGFLKECYCCRESYLHERVVTLTHCYDPDGTRLTAMEMATMDIRLKEPAECRCFKCGDFSR